MKCVKLAPPDKKPIVIRLPDHVAKLAVEKNGWHYVAKSCYKKSQKDIRKGTRNAKRN